MVYLLWMMTDVDILSPLLNKPFLPVTPTASFLWNKNLAPLEASQDAALSKMAT